MQFVLQNSGPEFNSKRKHFQLFCQPIITPNLLKNSLTNDAKFTDIRQIPTNLYQNEPTTYPNKVKTRLNLQKDV